MNVQGELLTPGMTYYNTRHYTSIKYSAATWYTCCFDDDRKEMLHTHAGLSLYLVHKYTFVSSRQGLKHA